jgi:hypothetical protein
MFLCYLAADIFYLFKGTTSSSNGDEGDEALSDESV